MHPNHHKLTPLSIPPPFLVAECSPTKQRQSQVPLPLEKVTFAVEVKARDKSWIIKRTYEQFAQLDHTLHLCIYDRRSANGARQKESINERKKDRKKQKSKKWKKIRKKQREKEKEKKEKIKRNK